MVKLYKLIMASVLSVVALAVNAINVTINVDSPERVKLSVNSVEQEIVAGDNAFDVEEYSSISIQAQAGAMLKSVVRASDGSSEYISGMTNTSIYISSGMEGEKWTVTSMLESDVRTGACRVKVDDASKVRMQRSGTYTDVVLTDGWNDVRYIPDTETQLMICSAYYGTPLYKVTLNGETVDSQYGTWYVNLSEGAEIEIMANFPDIDVPVRFVYADEDSKGFITGVSVDGESTDRYNGQDFTVKAGALMTISMNTTDYGLDEFSVNGTPVSLYSNSYSMTVTEETNISVKAHKYGTISATIDIDNPDNVIVYRGYYYENNVMNLIGGKNTIELSETNTLLNIKAASGCYITSVTDSNGNTYSADYNNVYNVTMSEGLTLTIVSGAIARDCQAVVYIDDRQAPAQYFSFTRSDRSEVDIVTGYNTVNFYSGDMPMGLSWYGAPYANVYLNDKSVAPLYEGSTTYQLELADGDVLKLYLASNPVARNVNFSVGEGVNAGDITVKRDMIKTVSDWNEGIKVFDGTQIDVAVADAENTAVTVDGVSVEQSEGVFTFVVKGDSDVKISKNGNDGISNMSAGTAAGHDVYNMLGVKVLDKADAGRVSELPAGCYIVNGRKVIVH